MRELEYKYPTQPLKRKPTGKIKTGTKDPDVE